MTYVIHIDIKKLEYIKNKIKVIWISNLFKGVLFVEAENKDILKNIKGINVIEENIAGIFDNLQTIKL